MRVVVPPLQVRLQAAQALHWLNLQSVRLQINRRLLRRLQEFEGVKMTATTANASMRVAQRVMARKKVKAFSRVRLLEGSQ